jgi:lipoprotein Spr
VDPKDIVNQKLYAFLDEWMHTPYLFGGDSKKGIDCSAFVRRLLKEIYGVEVPRVSVAQFLDKRIVRYSDPKYLHEGDLVFFTLDENKTVSHVGMYLQNNRFINCDTEKGVCIRDLKAGYWKKSLVAYGRIKSL